MELIRPQNIDMPGTDLSPEDAAKDRAITQEEADFIKLELARIEEAERAAFDLT